MTSRNTRTSSHAEETAVPIDFDIDRRRRRHTLEIEVPETRESMEVLHEQPSITSLEDSVSFPPPSIVGGFAHLAIDPLQIILNLDLKFIS